MSDTSDLVIGIDAGGTSVRAALADAVSGEILESVQGAADSEGGPESLSSLLPQLRQHAEGAGQRIVSICAGITKISRTGVQASWERALGEYSPDATVTVVPDYVIAFHGAIPEGNGVTVIAGTGSVVYGEHGSAFALETASSEVHFGRQGAVRVGGRGWEYGDEGSGAWLTTEAVRRTLRALDGLEESSPLTRAICAELGTDEPAALGEAARQRAAGEGRGFLVPLALTLARDTGDTEAANLFVGAAGWLAAQVRAASTRLKFESETPVTVAIVGGMWESGDLIRKPFDTVLRRWLPNARIMTGEASPVVGAVRLARRVAPSY